MFRLLRLPSLALLVSTAFLARAGEPAIIAKARAYVGSEDVLNAVRSIRMRGAFMVTSGPSGVPESKTPSQVDIIFQKPYQHHLVVTSELGVRTLALDGFDGWESGRFPATATPTLRLLTPDQVWVLRADVWENLGYYRGIEAEGGRVEDQGPATVDGVACEKIAFIHAPDQPPIAYYRYFDLATGRLVFTETSGGLQIREQGEKIVDGIRFPEKIVTSHKPGKGSQTVTTLTVESVTVNETFPDSLFAVPLPPIPVRTETPAPSAAPAAPAINPIVAPKSP